MVLSMKKKMRQERIRSTGVGAVILIRVLRDGFPEKHLSKDLK